MSHTIPLLLALALAATLSACGAQPGAGDRPAAQPKPATQPAQPKPTTRPASAFDISTRKAEDAVKVIVENGKTILSIRSVSGIGSATIKAETWPEPLILRLYLRGLESFAVVCGRRTLAGSVLSHSGFTKRLRLQEGDDEGPEPNPGSPFWMEIKVFDAAGQPAKGLPGKGGYFEMAIPKALLTDKKLEVTWIDFFRG